MEYDPLFERIATDMSELRKENREDHKEIRESVQKMEERLRVAENEITARKSREKMMMWVIPIIVTLLVNGALGLSCALPEVDHARLPLIDEPSTSPRDEAYYMDDLREPEPDPREDQRDGRNDER